jgi:hypothetical protein
LKNPLSSLRFVARAKRGLANGRSLNLVDYIIQSNGFRGVVSWLESVIASVHPRPALIPIPVRLTIQNRSARHGKEQVSRDV